MFREVIAAALGAGIGAVGTWWALQERAPARDVEAAAARGHGEVVTTGARGSAGGGPPTPVVRRVLVRVPGDCDDSAGTGGQADAAWPKDVPPAFRPDAFVEALDQEAARFGVHVPYAVDCSRFPCMVILEEPLSQEDNEAVMTWANALHNPGGIPNSDMYMSGNRKITAFFIYPDSLRNDAAFKGSLRDRARSLQQEADP